MTLTRMVLVFVLVAVVACGDGTSPPEILASSDTLTMSGGSRVIEDSLKVVVGYTTTDGDLLQTLFDATLMGDDDDGIILIADASDPDFAAFRAAMTNGVDESVGVGLVLQAGGSGTTTYLESNLYVGRPGTGPDFAGSSITGIEFHVETIILNSPGTDPNGDGLWTSYTIRGIVVVLGHP